MKTSDDFGPRLRAMRERRGISLETIAATTKISVPLLHGLERGDVSHWPKGIFRRAFFRDYAAAVGAPVEDTLAEFLQYFPENGHAPADAPCSAPRMTLATIPPPIPWRVMRIVAGLVDAAVVVLLGVVSAWWLGVAWSTGVVVAGLLYYPLVTGWLGRSPLLSWRREPVTVGRRWRTARARTEPEAVTLHAVSEAVREVEHDASLQRDRRTGVDRRRAPRLAHEPEATPIPGVFELHKGSAA
jgi:hypothetical protein